MSGACASSQAMAIWAEVAPKAGISLVHAGLCVASRRPEAAAVLEAFLATEMGEGCELLRGEALTKRFPFLAPGQDAVLWSNSPLVSSHWLPVLAP